MTKRNFTKRSKYVVISLCKSSVKLQSAAVNSGTYTIIVDKTYDCYYESCVYDGCFITARVLTKTENTFISAIIYGHYFVVSLWLLLVIVVEQLLILI